MDLSSYLIIYMWFGRLAKNGKEMPYASFNNASGHFIIKDLKSN